ncbi:hypothetical protein BTO32_15440 [Marinobacter lutaoensis]|uniref:N-acetyltransferase domain-containing protein n=1 Tax=Marinobacter lutaoensis TaxID=135739 RepID=A0A1V2DPZ0_9GAMM|nr:GNAT family N-acetyltransferase [Marinobacter lutaoensis]ONF42599.1 hypothetical protein BTO32_15440 [Marinobacter lutaoensis]
MDLEIQELEKRHNRRKFDCGDPALNTFLTSVARQKHQRLTARTYVLVDRENNPSEILGFYTLVPCSMEFPQGHSIGKRLGECPPAIRLARLGVSLSVQGQGVGKFLVISALCQIVAASLSVGGVGCVVDAKNDNAKRFYEKMGFVPLDADSNDSLTLWLPMAQCIEVVDLVERAESDQEAAE